jgi:trehalose 6-phosphate phosphatase
MATSAAEQLTTLDLRTHALLLDVDGTLLDIAAKPHLVEVPADLIETLRRLRDKTGGAIAFVSGREIAVLDKLFQPLRLPAIGGHGAEMRIGEGAATRRAPDLPEAMRQRLRDEAAAIPSVLTEDKGYSFTLHFRQAAAREDDVLRAVAQVRKIFPDVPSTLQTGKMMIELKHPDAEKKLGVVDLMGRGVFAGRIPVFIGDDDTDEPVFSTMSKLGGLAFSVGRKSPGLTGVFTSPADLRGALRMLAFRA